MLEVVTDSPAKLRNARACEACRASKSRCFKSNEEDLCKRCKQIGSQCIVRSKARPMRTRSMRHASGGSTKNLAALGNDLEFSIDLPPVIAPDSAKVLDELYEHHKLVLGDVEDLMESPSRTDSRLAVIEQRKIDLKQAEVLLSAFRHKAPLFPFVIIPEKATVSSLSRNSPFLLLAILTVASGMDTPLSHQLDHEFRYILSSKVVVEGQKSLDFLQGLLLYIAWYPIHSRPRNNQAFMYLALAISLVVDLGLERETPNMISFNTFSSQGLVEDGLFTSAAKSAYLGCYYLSVALSMGFQKPNNLQYRNLMDSYGMSLLQSGSPDEINALVKLQYLTERIADLHKSKETVSFDLTSDMNIQIFLNELQEWRARTPAKIRSLPHIALAEHFANITIFSYELGFLRRPYPSEPTLSSPQSHLTSCLSASKTFFETLLSIPEVAYPHFSTVQYAMVIQAIVVLSRLTFLIAATLNWDAGTTRSNIPLVMYLDALCYRFEALSSTQVSGSDVPKQPDTLYVFAMVLGSVKRSYARRVSKIRPTPVVDHDNLGGPGRGLCPLQDPSLRVYFDRDIASEYDGEWSSSADTPPSVSRVMSTPLYHDLWATMTGSWANDI